eukprot:scaffold64750_cov45-Phaeocystis_antarctica.AAC.1
MTTRCTAGGMYLVRVKVRVRVRARVRVRVRVGRRHVRRVAVCEVIHAASLAPRVIHGDVTGLARVRVRARVRARARARIRGSPALYTVMPPAWLGLGLGFSPGAPRYTR